MLDVVCLGASGRCFTLQAPTQSQLIRALMLCVIILGAGVPCTQSFGLPQANITFSAGENLRLKVDKTISSATARVGDQVEAELRTPRIANVTGVLGEVVAARAANKAQRIPAHLTLAFSQIVLADGRTIPMDASIELNGWGKTVGAPLGLATSFALGLAGGLIGGLIGGAADGGRGAAIGIPIGSLAGAIGAAFLPNTNWRDVRIKKGRTFAVKLSKDVHFPSGPTAKP